MIKIIATAALCIFLLSPSSDIFAQAKSHGELQRGTTGEPQIWDAETDQWLDLQVFWLAYAKSKGGVFWGRD